MRTRSRNLVLLCGALLAGAAIVALPAISQEQPESILPPSFDPPQPPKPAKPPQEQPSSGGEAVAPSGGSSGGTVVKRRPRPRPAPSSNGGTFKNIAPGAADEKKDPNSEEIDPNAPMPIIVDIPPQSRRSTDVVGTIGPGEGEMGLNAFQNMNGLYLSPIMNHIKAPIVSRWASIFLRRALLSHSKTPDDVDGADWAADRASLLVRMGEAQGARSLVQAVDVDQYTPRMFKVALDVAVANADPAMLCGMTEYVNDTKSKSDEEDDDDSKKKAAAQASDKGNMTHWKLAKAMCAGLANESGVANANLDKARDEYGEKNNDDPDILFAEKVVGAGTKSKRNVAIEWGEITSFNNWRWGMATATGLTIPDKLYAGLGPEVRGWAALAPLLPAAQRFGFVDHAAELGILSGQALIAHYSMRYDQTDPSERSGKPFDQLRLCYVGKDPTDRIAAMKTLWTDAKNAAIPRYSGLIATAYAATNITPNGDNLADAGNLVASMLSVGLDPAASKWKSVIGDAANNAGWGLLAVASAKPIPNISQRMIESFGASGPENKELRGQFLFAALAGLGRLPKDDVDQMAKSFQVPIGHDDKWVSALRFATRAHASGAVAILAATGLQAEKWSDIPAFHLYHIVRSLRAVGYEPEARMIAAEALMRI